uniref:Replication termination factor 2 n=1 Tax=Trichuris muris TaxID=70415 RepID=A0A5S6QBG5_TRIMR
MGCDGGTIPTRGELVRTKKKAAKVERQVANAAKWKHCSLTQERLKRPIVASRIGKLYNKEAVIEALIRKKTGIVCEGLDCIDSLKDIKELTLTKNPAYDTKSEEVVGGCHDFNVAEYMCPIAGVEMNGNHRFVVLWSCGCVISEKALKEIESSACGNCGIPYSADDVIVIYGTEEEMEAYRLKLNKLRARRESRKQVAGSGYFDSQPGPSGTQKRKADESLSINGASSIDQASEASKLMKTSIQEDPTTSKTYKSLFTTCKEAKERPQPHWVTYNPLYY